MRDIDLPAVMAIQRACYLPEMNEPLHIMQRRLGCVPQYCWIAVLAEKTVAYLMSYPSRLGRITRLGDDFSPATAADSLYLHDLAVAPEAGGKGVGQALVRHALAEGGWLSAGLVCVQAAQAFWQRQGFAPGYPLAAEEAANLATYPTEPRYLVWRSA